MLTQLSIDNYALIDKSAVDFHEGFTVITGETGAGKSIMLDALGLLMGARADAKAMGSKERKTVVEATFSYPAEQLKSLFEENGLDWDSEEIILRREISPSGKSRAFINDTPVNLNILSLISERLIDIHSQHSNSLLNTPAEQLSIIDSFGHTQQLLNEYKASFKDYVALRNKIKKIKDAITAGKENREFIVFRLEQLDKLKPKKGELSELEREAEILGDADRIQSSLLEANEMIDGPTSAIKYVQNASSILDGLDLNLLDPHSEDNILERINNLKIELRDISDTLEGYADKIKSDPDRLEKIQTRIESLYEVMKRFKVKDEAELVDLHVKLKEELAMISGDNGDISSLEKDLKEHARELKERADSLTDSRTKAAEEFSKVIINRIAPLGMPNVNFKVEIEKGKMSQEGQDQVTFLCSFNKNHPLQPVSNIASGGEISRVMLGIKAIMAENMHLPTIIFDEIDTGVSGEIAHKMGEMIKEMSGSHQVMAVTHLPQVAAHGEHHMKVFKSDNLEKTVSHIKELDFDERVREIASMLSGNTINEIALENAKVLLKR